MGADGRHGPAPGERQPGPGRRAGGLRRRLAGVGLPGKQQRGCPDARLRACRLWRHAARAERRPGALGGDRCHADGGRAEGEGGGAQQDRGPGAGHAIGVARGGPLVGRGRELRGPRPCQDQLQGAELPRQQVPPPPAHPPGGPRPRARGHGGSVRGGPAGLPVLWDHGAHLRGEPPDRPLRGARERHHHSGAPAARGADGQPRCGVASGRGR
mmetsp:Transcript_154510/g.474872  ORF Transcript_154510/g.474872 Transcript_154510/m.474872 type:complete len:213 (+) Transcript_154510:790-1428(+)